MIETRVFWDRDRALEWLQEASYPLVFKLKGGAGSSNVVLVKNRLEARRLTKRMFSTRGVEPGRIPSTNNLAFLRDFLKLYAVRRRLASWRGRLGPGGISPYWQIERDYVLFQKYLPGNTFDTRVTVIGERAFAFLRHNRENDFRASGGGRIDYQPSNVDLRCVRLALDISKAFAFQSMAYDFLYNENNQPEIAEISYSFLDTAVHQCPGYWGKDLNFHAGNFWPQFCQLEDLIEEMSLRPPPESIML
jgi:hypothetical protein